MESKSKCFSVCHQCGSCYKSARVPHLSITHLHTVLPSKQMLLIFIQCSTATILVYFNKTLNPGDFAWKEKFTSNQQSDTTKFNEICHIHKLTNIIIKKYY